MLILVGFVGKYSLGLLDSKLQWYSSIILSISLVLVCVDLVLLMSVVIQLLSKIYTFYLTSVIDLIKFYLCSAKSVLPLLC